MTATIQKYVATVVAYLKVQSQHLYGSSKDSTRNIGHNKQQLVSVNTSRNVNHDNVTMTMTNDIGV